MSRCYRLIYISQLYFDYPSTLYVHPFHTSSNMNESEEEIWKNMNDKTCEQTYKSVKEWRWKDVNKCESVILSE